MLDKENKEKIERYIEGKADEGELRQIEEMFSKGEDYEALKDSLKKDWYTIVAEAPASDVNLSHILDRVHHIINRNENFKLQRPLRKISQIYMKVAAVLLIPLLIAVFGYVYKTTRKVSDQSVNAMILAPMGARVSFNLPDGTTGMLNSGSELRYSLPFSNDRKVTLEGEAWFDVSHDAKHPFRVTSGKSTINVLGTRFNMSSYPDEDYVEVVLEEGKVSYMNQTIDKPVEISPSERMVCRHGKITKTVTEPLKYKAWTEGKLVFRGDPMGEVARRIERWYNVEIILADNELNKYSFRGIFMDDSLEDVLRFLCMTSPISYKISPRQMMPDGTYKKEVVKIFKK